jgi:hypothetical protein
MLGTHFHGALAGLRIKKNNIEICLIVGRNERSKWNGVHLKELVTQPDKIVPADVEAVN